MDSGRCRIGKVGDAWVLASETCALGFDPREIRARRRAGRNRHHRQERLDAASRPFRSRSAARFAFSNTFILRGRTARLPIATFTKCAWRWAAQLARENPIEADMVVPVPDSGNCAALGYSLESGIPLRDGVRAQPLRRAQLSAAVAADSRFQRAREVESDWRTGARTSA